MSASIGCVVELVGPDSALGQFPSKLFCQALRHLDVIVGALVGLGRHFDDLGPIEPQSVLFLLALRLGNDDHRLEAERIGHQRQPDPGIARSAFHNRATGLQRARLHRIMDDKQSRTVLDRLAGIEELRLAPNVTSGELRHPIETDQRRIADSGKKVFVRGHQGQSGLGWVFNLGSLAPTSKAEPRKQVGFCAGANKASISYCANHIRGHERPPAPEREKV